MSDRGVQFASVYHLEQARARRGLKLGRGQLRRVSPRLRPAKALLPAGWTFDEWRQAEKENPESLPRLRVRRGGNPIRSERPKLSRQARRLAWKAERRSIWKVRWDDSRSKAGEMAPVVPLRSRSSIRRHAA